MQPTENQPYNNILALLPIDVNVNSKGLAKLLGMKPKRIARILNGTANNVTVTELRKIAAHYNIPIQKIID